jgi:hypothetical protein
MSTIRALARSSTVFETRAVRVGFARDSDRASAIRDVRYRAQRPSNRRRCARVRGEDPPANDAAGLRRSSSCSRIVSDAVLEVEKSSPCLRRSAYTLTLDLGAPDEVAELPDRVCKTGDRREARTRIARLSRGRSPGVGWKSEAGRQSDQKPSARSMVRSVDPFLWHPFASARAVHPGTGLFALHADRPRQPRVLP